MRNRVITFWSTRDMMACVGVAFFAGALIATVIGGIVAGSHTTPKTIASLIEADRYLSK